MLYQTHVKVDIIGKMKDKKLLNRKEIAGSFLYIPSLQKQELLYRLLDKINIERNIFHIRPYKVHKWNYSSPLYEKSLLQRLLL